jgi:hypothetical protein
MTVPNKRQMQASGGVRERVINAEEDADLSFQRLYVKRLDSNW